MTSSADLLASYELLRHVAAADGAIAPAEQRALEEAARSAGAQFTPEPPRTTVEDSAARVRDPELRARTLRAAIALANADGTCTESEAEVLSRIAAALELPAPELLGRVAAQATPELRAAKTAANDRFMHRMSDAAAKGELTQQRYEGLLAELEGDLSRLAS